MNKYFQVLNTYIAACLADEELKAEEDSIEETRRRNEEQSRWTQLEAQRREEEKRIREERMYVFNILGDSTLLRVGLCYRE